MTSINREEISDLLAEATQELNALKSMKESKGFSYFAALVQGGQDIDVSRYFAAPTESLDAALAENYEKGRIYATMNIFIKLDTRIEALKSDIEHLHQRLEEDPES